VPITAGRRSREGDSLFLLRTTLARATFLAQPSSMSDAAADRPDRPTPIRPTDAEARALARTLVAEARFGALGVIHPDTGFPHVTRIAVGADPEGGPLTLISELSLHTRALKRQPRACLLVGEPDPRGDPLTHPRISLDVEAAFVSRGPEHDRLRALWLARHPKAKLYVDFADFSFVRLQPLGAALNGGFGKAYQLGAEDLRPA
jgi:putative heme iron utilization protein